MLLRKGPNSHGPITPRVSPPSSSPTTHPLNGWQLWREDKFDGSTGTVFNRWMWARIEEGGPDGIDHSYFQQLSPHGMRLLSSYGGSQGATIPKSAKLVSGPHWYLTDEFGRHGHSNHSQSYQAPFMITARCRMNWNNRNHLNGTWMHQPFTDLKEIGDGFPSDPDGRFAMETDGDESKEAWNVHTMSYHLNSQNSAVLTNSHHSWQQSRSAILGEWYDMGYIVDTDARTGGTKKITTFINNTTRERSLTDWDAEYHPYLEHVWHVPHNVTIMNLGLADWEDTPTSGDPSYYDIEEFRVWLPPGDPRLSASLMSAVPGWTGVQLPDWKLTI